MNALIIASLLLGSATDGKTVQQYNASVIEVIGGSEIEFPRISEFVAKQRRIADVSIHVSDKLVRYHIGKSRIVLLNKVGEYAFVDLTKRIGVKFSTTEDSLPTKRLLAWNVRLWPELFGPWLYDGAAVDLATKRIEPVRGISVTDFPIETDENRGLYIAQVESYAGHTLSDNPLTFLMLRNVKGFATIGAIEKVKDKSFGVFLQVEEAKESDLLLPVSKSVIVPDDFFASSSFDVMWVDGTNQDIGERQPVLGMSILEFCRLFNCTSGQSPSAAG